jgi:hypothetical protein
MTGMPVIGVMVVIVVVVAEGRPGRRGAGRREGSRGTPQKA